MVKSPEYPHIDTTRLGEENTLLALLISNPKKWIPDPYVSETMGWKDGLIWENCMAIRHRFRRMLPGVILELEGGTVYYPEEPDPIIIPVGFRPHPPWAKGDILHSVFTPLAWVQVTKGLLTAEPVFSRQAYEYWYQYKHENIPVEVQPPTYIRVPAFLRVRAR